MNAIVDESQRENVDDNWLRPPIFLLYLLRDYSTAGSSDDYSNQQLFNYANVTQRQSLLGQLPSDVLFLADAADQLTAVTPSMPIAILKTTISTLSAIIDGGQVGNDSSTTSSSLSSSDLMDASNSNNVSSDYVDGGADNDMSENYSSPYLMPWPQRTSWIAIFTLMLFVAIVGNTLVAWIVLAHRRMKTVTNYFLVNLSLADLTMSLFNCIFNFTFMLNSHWPFGGFYCTVNNFIANVTVAASVFTLVAISFDRYIAIVHPLRPRMSKCIARIAITLIWLASCILAVPCLLYSQIISHKYSNGEIRIVCIVVWPDGLPSVSQQDFIYNIVFTVLTYLIPVSVMGVCYSRMSYILWRSQTIGELNIRQAESIQSKRKVVRMFMVIVLLFAVCWLPYHGYFVYQFIDGQVISYKYVQHIFLAFYWLAMSNAMINPLVYYYMNARFRQYFKTVLCHFLCRGRRLSTMTELAGAAAHLGHPGRRSSPDRSLPPGPIVSSHLHGLRSRHSGMNGQLSGQPNGLTGVATLIRHQQQPDHSSSSHSNSRHSIQHEGHQRCLVFGKLPETHQQHNQSHHYCHHHHQYHMQQQHQQQQGVYYCCSTTGGGHNNGGGAIRWITARKNFNSVWLPLTTLSAPPSLEIYDSRGQNYRRTNNGHIKNNSNNFLADTKI